jgi:hypothetical protein
MSLVVQDATGAKQNMSTTTDASGNLVGSTCVTDPTSGAKQTVSQAHTADQQNVSSAYSALAAALNMLWNGTTFDRQRGNVDAVTPPVTLSSQAAGTVNSADLTNVNHKGVQIGVNISALSASTTVQVTVQGKDAASGVYYTLLQSAAIAATGFTLLTVYPGGPTTTNVAANQVLPRTWRVSVVVAGSGTASATVGASVIV